MAHISRYARKWVALTIWFAGLIIAAALGIWTHNVNTRDAENRLIGEAARSAGELAGLLTYDGRSPTEMSARALVAGAMEDERIYAVKVTVDGKMLDGQRRNYLWEPIAWDDEIAEKSIQGINPVKITGKPVGRVEVWISTRSTNEDKAISFERELFRFFVFACMWSFVLLLLFWHWGILQRWIRKLRFVKEPRQVQETDKIILGLCARKEQPECHSDISEPVNAVEGRKHQRVNPDAWFVTAGMFRQTFGRAPDLMSRLYADGEIAGLCHLGRMLEQAAPCVGAERLKKSASGMQKALNNPESESDALAVDECVAALEEVLHALCGNQNLSIRPSGARS